MYHKLTTTLFASLLFFGIYTTTTAQYRSGEIPQQEANTSKGDFLSKFQWIASQDAPVHEFHFSGGYSFHSTRGFWGKIPGASLAVLGLRYNRKLYQVNDQHTIEYVTELNFSVDYTLTSTKYNFRRGTFSGFGITPIGFQFNWEKEHTVQPFFKSSAGFMYFKNRFPDSRGSKFNFTLELGGGIEFMILESLSLTVGYKYHHMSNGQFGDINPGVDSNVFYTGITIF